MKKILIVFLFASCFSFGQFALDTGTFFYDHRSSKTGIVYNIMGSPYEEGQFFDGNVSLFTKKSLNVTMRYNSAKDVIEFLDEDGKTKELLRRPYIKAKFAGKTYEVLTYIKEDVERLAYFNRLNSGATQIWYKPKKILKISQQLFQEKKQGHYKESSTYYISKNGKPAERIRLNKAALLAQLNDQSLAVNRFISDYNLNLKNESDIIRLIEYYNSLLGSQPAETKIQS